MERTDQRRAWWVGGILVAGFALGNWMRDPVTLWATTASVGLLAAAALLRPWRGWARPALALVAPAFALLLGYHQVRLHLLTTAWPDELEIQTLAAADRSREVLREAYDRAVEAATGGLAAADLPTEVAFGTLAALASDQTFETGLAIVEPDSSLRAWAGRHRVPPVFGPDTTVLRTTSFFAVLEVRRLAPSGRAVVATVLLDVQPGVPERPASMAARFEAKTGVGLEVYPPGVVPDSLDPFDYKVPVDGGERTLYTVRFLPPTQGEAVEAALEAGNHRAVWFLLALVTLALVVARRPTERFLLLGVFLWVGLRAPAGEALGLDTLFSPSVFFPGRLPDQALLGPFSRSAGTLLLSSTLVLLLAVYAWRRALPRRWIGVTAGGLLLLGAPFIVRELGRGITPPAAGVSTGLWLAWHITLLVATAAMLGLVAALFRGTKTPRRKWPVLVGVTWSIAAAAVGLLVFAGRSGWPDWYWILWGPALLLVCLPAPRRLAILGIAITAGGASALMTWAAEVEGRVELARRDFYTLGGEPDPLAEPTLAGFGDRLRLGPLPTTATDLYARWVGSVLDTQGYPTELALWSTDGTRLVDLPLHAVDLPATDLAAAVRALPDTATRRILSRDRVPGVHYVLVERLDSARVATAVLGPRTVLLAPSRLGRLLASRPERPLYRMLMVPTPVNAPVDEGRERWAREGWLLRAEQTMLLPGGPRLIQAVVELGTPALLLVRGALVVFLDVVLLSLLWQLGELIAGAAFARPDWLSLRRSFRVRLGVALLGFFLLPAVGFAIWSLARLRQQALESRDLVIAELLRDAASGLRREFGPDLPERLASRSERVDVELGYYRHGTLVASSTPVLVDLGLMEPVMSARGYQSIAGAGETTHILGGGTVSQPHRMGYRVFQAPGERDIAMIATRVPAGDPELLSRQLDIAMILLFGTLLASGAAMAGAQVAARALSRPVRELREAALRIGRGLDPAAPAAPAPLEFAPVFAAFERMASDIRTSQSALEESRRQTAAVLATVATGVVGVDESGRVLIANRRAGELLGQELPEGAPLADALRAEWRELARRVDRILATADAASAPAEMEAGDRRLSILFARLDGPRPGLVMAISDITAVARAARVLAWGEMASQVAHEIKNPLTPMRLGIQHLQRVYRDGRERFGETLEETSRRILGEIDRLDTIARAFSRYAAPAEESSPLEVIGLTEVAEEVLQFYRLSPDGVQVALESSDPQPVAARRDEVKEVLINLLENARNAGAHRIAVAVTGRILTVTDDGSGIPADALPRIFEPRFSTTTSGSGLGLAIVRRLVEGWGGSVEVESAVDMGTTVRVRLCPASRTGVSSEAPSAPAPP